MSNECFSVMVFWRFLSFSFFLSLYKKRLKPFNWQLNSAHSWRSWHVCGKQQLQLKAIQDTLISRIYRPNSVWQKVTFSSERLIFMMFHSLVVFITFTGYRSNQSPKSVVHWVSYNLVRQNTTTSYSTMKMPYYLLNVSNSLRTFIQMYLSSFKISEHPSVHHILTAFCPISQLYWHILVKPDFLQDT